MNAAELGTAEQIRDLARAAAPAVTAPPDLAGRVLARLDVPPRRRGRRLGVGIGVLVIAGAVAAAGVHGRGDYRNWTQPSGAMSPTVAVGQTVVIGKQLVPQRGDVVLIVAVHGAERFETLSRVVGLPGDTVSCPAEPDGSCAGVVVSGARLAEPWLDVATEPFPPTTVGGGEVFLLGDARDAAVDSRMFGPQRLDAVLGVAVARIEESGQRAPLEGTSRTAPGDEEPVDPADRVPPARTG